MIQKIWKQIIELLWPRTCPFCGKCSRNGVCEKCKNIIKEMEISEPRCMKCGKPIRYKEQEYCQDCTAISHIYDRGVSMWLHKPPISTSIYQFKYHNQRYYAEVYAEMMTKQYREKIQRWRPQALIPVPVHPVRRRRRGYNQAELLAYALGKRLAIPVIPHLVKRRRYTGFQKKLNPVQRQKNLEHAFAPGGEIDRWPSGLKRVLIIDDIYTTGNTMDQVAQILKNMGVQKVYFLTVSIGQGD